MGITITDDLLKNAQMSESEFRLELAIFLFQKEIFTLGKASEFAGWSQIEMQLALANRKIPIHYGLDELEEDLATIQSMKKNS